MTFEKLAKQLIEENITPQEGSAFFKNCWYNLYGDYLQMVKFEKESYGYFSIRYGVQPLYVPLFYYEKWNEFGHDLCNASFEYAHAYNDEEVNWMKSKELCVPSNMEKCAMLLRDYVNPRLTSMANPTVLLGKVRTLDKFYIKAALGEYEQTISAIEEKKKNDKRIAQKAREQNMSEDYCSNFETYMDRVYGPMVEAIRGGTCDAYLNSIRLRNMELIEKVIGLEVDRSSTHN